MVVEDAIELARIFTDILEMNGMRVEMITDGALAMQRLEVEVPDLVLLDMHLPNVSGIDILTYIRETPRLKHTQVVAVTANALLTADLMDRVELLLIKPVTLSQISELTQRLLKN
jgi:CheY-like chemotaxis protein